MLFLILYLFRLRSRRAGPQKTAGLFAKPGCTFALMFILYGLTRFLMELLRDDNPFEYAWWAVYKGGTVSQNLGIYMIVIGVVLIVLFQKMRPGVTVSCENDKMKNSNRKNERATKTNSRK